MLFVSSAFLALLSAVLADHTFTLTASGGVEGPVTFANNALTIGNGDAPVLVLEEPTGFVNIQGTSNYLQLSPGGIGVSSQSDASRSFQILNGVTFAAGPASDNAQWFACSADVGYIIKTFQDTGCQPVTLNVVGAQEQPAATDAEPESTDAPAEEEAAPEPETTEPAAPEPETTEPAAPEPETTEPSAPEPETTEPAAPEPEATEPGAEEPGAEEPESTEPAAEEPETTEAAGEEPTESPEPSVTPLEGAGVKLSTGAGAVVAAFLALLI